MAFRLSTGARNFLNKYGSIDRMLNGGIIEIYSGAQPTSPDAAPTGTLLCTVSLASGAVTSEVLATGTVTLTAGASGSVSSITVNGVEVLGTTINFDGTLTQTAADIAAQINRNDSAVDYTATSSGAVITISAMPGTGASPNGFVVAATAATITTSTTNMASGVTAVNGLRFDVSSGGAMTKRSSDTWSGSIVATGTAGWFRQYGSVSDSHAIDSAGTALRIDGAVSTSGAEMNLNSTAFTSGATFTLSSWSMTVPAQ